MKKILENVRKHAGLSVVYSSFVTGEGLAIFAKVLDANGWRPYRKNVEKRTSERVYAFITGQVSAEDRDDVIKTFNQKSNMNGDFINMMLLSGAGAEGLDLRNVNSIHIMEPYWNYLRLLQIIARAVRYLSHTDYPEGERAVQPYIYLSDYPEDYSFKPTKQKPVAEKTTDVHLYTNSINARKLIYGFYGAMIESSIDCSLHIKSSPADIQSKIKCVMCKPTDTRMFHPNIAVDMKTRNPCKKPTRMQVDAKQLEHEGVTYYYTNTHADGVTIYVRDDSLDAYVKLGSNHSHYSSIVNKVQDAE